MEALLMSLALKYGKGKLTDTGIAWAMKKLGMGQSNQNPKHTFGMPFTNNKVSINPMRMIANQGIKALTGGGSMGMALPLTAGGLGLAYLRNPLRSGSMNYNPELQGQMDYLSSKNMIESTSSGTKYKPNSILNNQNVVSMFGTNDYLDQLNKYKDKYKDTMPKDRLNKLNQEIADYELDQVNKELKARQNINAANNGGSGGIGSGGSFNTSKPSPSRSSRHGSLSGGLHSNYRRGGIASL